MTPVVPSARAGDRHGQFSRAGTSATVALRAPALDLALRPESPPPSPDHLLPNLLLAGVTHAGASALGRSLGRHPDVKLPVVQRLDHYSPLRFGQPIQATLADYDRHFATWRGQRYRLERSPVYFDGGQELVDAVARDLPEVRVLILLRDPVQRLWTSYQDKVARGRLPGAMTYETYVEHCLALRVNEADRFEGNRYFRTLSSGLYVDHLDRWLTAFGDRVRVVFAEGLDRTPRAAMAGMFTWLGLDPDTARPRERGASAVGLDGREPSWLQSFGSDDGRRRRPSLAGTADLVRRVARGRLPRQADRLRGRLDQFYAGSNRRLADRLREAGYTDLPGWLDTVA